MQSCPVKFSRSANASFDWSSTKSYCAFYEYPSSPALPYLLLTLKPVQRFVWHHKLRILSIEYYRQRVVFIFIFIIFHLHSSSRSLYHHHQHKTQNTSTCCPRGSSSSARPSPMALGPLLLLKLFPRISHPCCDLTITKA